MRLEQYITEAVSSGKRSKLSNEISLRKFKELLVDSLTLEIPMQGFPGDDDMYTERPDLFFRIMHKKANGDEVYARMDYEDRTSRFYYMCPIEPDRDIIWHIEFEGDRLISCEEYSYAKWKLIFETDGIEAIEELIDFLSCQDFEDKKRWKQLNG